MSSETDVVIIGAGSAGLSAAKELARLGLTYTLIEGSHRIGGLTGLRQLCGLTLCRAALAAL